MRKGNLMNRSGFTLVELLVVLIIISILVTVSAVGAIAVRVQTNESTTKKSLKDIVTAEESYRMNEGIYADSLATLGPTYLGSGLEGGESSGYLFELKSANQGESFTVTAVPKVSTRTGIKRFCVDTANAINVYEGVGNLTADGSDCPPGGSIAQG